MSRETQYTTVVVRVLVDEDGDHVAVEDGGDLEGRYEEQVRPLAECQGLRTVLITVKVPLPTVIELSGEVTADETATGLAVA